MESRPHVFCGTNTLDRAMVYYRSNTNNYDIETGPVRSYVAEVFFFMPEWPGLYLLQWPWFNRTIQDEMRRLSCSPNETPVALFGFIVYFLRHAIYMAYMVYNQDNAKKTSLRKAQDFMGRRLTRVLSHRFAHVTDQQAPASTNVQQDLPFIMLSIHPFRTKPQVWSFFLS